MSSHEFRKIPPRGTNVEDNAQHSAARRSPINVTNANDPARRQKRPKSPQRIDRSTQMLQDLMSKNRVEALSGEVWLINIAHVEGQVPCRFRFCE